MKRHKPLLPLYGMTMLEAVIRPLFALPFYEIVTVIGYREQQIKDQIHLHDPRFRWCSNPDYRDGQSTALKAAVKALESSDGILFFLADQPFIQLQTIKKVFDQAKQAIMYGDPGIVIQPAYQERPGHPVFISKAMFPLLNQITGDTGAKPVIQLAAIRQLIHVDDAGIHIDIDTPEEYDKLPISIRGK